MGPRFRQHRRRVTMAATIALIAVVSGCGSAEVGTSDGRTSSSAPAAVAQKLPPTAGVFDYQLGGAYDELAAASAGDGSTVIDVVVRDARSDPLPGAYSVCYVNGFQTQPGEADDWTDDEDVLLHHGDGDLVVDPDWPDEHILDPTTKHARTVILDRLGEVIDDCADRGFAAVEIDNLDIAQRFDAIPESGVQALARSYVERAHQAGMAIAQKNAAEITRTAHDDLGFDFAVAEECAAFDECAAYTEVYGDHVLGIEYPDTLAEAGLSFPAACADPDRPPLMIQRDRDLVPADDHAADDHGYRYDSC